MAIASITYRSSITPISVLAGFEAAGVSEHRYAPVAAAVIAVNLILLIGLLLGRFRSLLRSRLFFACDLALTVFLVLWAEALIRPGTLLLPYRDTFSFYTLGTLALWTSLRGARTGVSLFTGGVLVALAAVWLDHANIGSTGVMVILARDGWLVTGLILPIVVIALARQGARLADAEGMRAGRAVERARVLRGLHDTALQALGQIARCTARREGVVDEAVFGEILDLTASQICGLRAALAQDDAQVYGKFTHALRSLASEFLQKGMRIELVATQAVIEAPASVADRLLSAVREALTNAWKHSGVPHVVVRVSDLGGVLEVVVRDHGVGFDPAVTVEGFGLRHSIGERLSEVGGRAELWSAPGEGTRITMTVPKGAEAPYLRGSGITSRTVIAISASESTDVAELVSRGINWFVLAALAYRVGLSPLQILAAVAALGLTHASVFIAAMSAVLLYDIALIAGMLSRRWLALLRSTLFASVDVCVAVSLNLWAAWALPQNTIMLPSREIFWAYMLGVVVLWTGLRSPWTGAVILAVGAGTLAAAIRLNGAVLNSIEWSQALAQEGWLIAAFGVAWTISWLAKRGARVALAEGLRAGRAEERAEALRALHDHVLETLGSIASLCAAKNAPRDARLRQVRGLALVEVAELRGALGQIDTAPRAGLIGELQGVANEFRMLGLRVELVPCELPADPPAVVTDGLLRAVREALGNVYQHSGAMHAVVSASQTGPTLEVVIRDHGRGFDPGTVMQGPPGRRHAVDSILQGVGGQAEVWTAPGQGTRVRLSVPWSS